MTIINGSRAAVLWVYFAAPSSEYCDAMNRADDMARQTGWAWKRVKEGEGKGEDGKDGGKELKRVEKEE